MNSGLHPTGFFESTVFSAICRDPRHTLFLMRRKRDDDHGTRVYTGDSDRPS